MLQSCLDQGYTGIQASNVMGPCYLEHPGMGPCSHPGDTAWFSNAHQVWLRKTSGIFVLALATGDVVENRAAVSDAGSRT